MVTRFLVNCFYPFRKSGNVTAYLFKTVPVTNFFFQRLFSFILFASFITYFLLAFVGNTYAQTAGDYRAITTGNWKAIGTWETYNGASWIAASAKPTSANGVIQIRAGHTVTVDTIITADQVLVDLLGTLTVNTTLNIANGAGTDITINGSLEVASTIDFAAGSSLDVNFLGTLKSTGTITTGASVLLNISGRFKREGGTMPTGAGIWTVNSGGTFEHAMNAGPLPLATWKSGATCEVTGSTSAAPTNLNQVFKSFKWNCTSQTANLDFAANLENIEEDLTISNTGSAHILFADGGSGQPLNVSIGRNFYIQGGITYICKNGSSTIDLTNGDIVISGGEFNFNQNTATSYGNLSAVVTVNGSVTVSAGTMDSRLGGSGTSKGEPLLEPVLLRSGEPVP